MATCVLHHTELSLYILARKLAYIQVLRTFSHRTSSMEQKIDELLQSVNTLKNAQRQSQQDITAKLDCLEHDVATNQEETLQLVAKS